MKATRTRRSGQRGKINVGCILGGFLFLVAVYLAFKFIPVRIAVAEAKDAAVQGAEFGTIKKDDQIRFEIMQKIRENHLPVKEQEILISRVGDTITIAFDIKVPIELVGGKVYVYHEKIDVKRTLF